MTTAAGPLYCERWDRVRRAPVVPLTEEQARHRFAHGPWFTVVLPPEDQDDGPVLLEIEAGLTTVTAVFLDAAGEPLVEYVYRRSGDSLRFTAGDARVPTDDGGLRLTRVAAVQQLWLRADGGCDVLVDTRAREGLQLGETELDVAAYSEPVPAFGDWAGLARYDR